MLLPRVAFYPSLLYNVVMERLSSRQWYNRIDENVILGALPTKGMTQQLANDEHVTGVLTMNEEYETRFFFNTLEEWQAAGIENKRVALPDMVAAPSDKQIDEGLAFISDHKQRGGCVYVHCKAGRTRSATIVAAYLMKEHSWSAEQAVSHMTTLRPHVWLRDKQWTALHNYETSCAKS